MQISSFREAMHKKLKDKCPSALETSYDKLGEICRDDLSPTEVRDMMMGWSCVSRRSHECWYLYALTQHPHWSIWCLEDPDLPSSVARYYLGVVYQLLERLDGFSLVVSQTTLFRMSNRDNPGCLLFVGSLSRFPVACIQEFCDRINAPSEVERINTLTRLAKKHPDRPIRTTDWPQTIADALGVPYLLPLLFSERPQ